jgi:putative DNA primase/helicase
VKDATGQYRTEMDSVGNFLEQCCQTSPGDDSIKCRAADLWAAYRAWCDRSGSALFNRKKFGEELTTRDHNWRDASSARWRLGITIRPPEEGESRCVEDGKAAQNGNPSWHPN